MGLATNCKNLNAARKKKDNEYYTPVELVRKELNNYNFRGKRVFCPCDGPDSAFVQYFHEMGVPVTWRQYAHPFNLFGERQPLRSSTFEEDSEYLQGLSDCDIVATNPPFSKFVDFICSLIRRKKKFIVLGDKLEFHKKPLFPLLQRGEIWGGYNCDRGMWFIRPSGERVQVGSSWYTNYKKPERPPFEPESTCAELKAAGKWKFYDSRPEVLFLPAVQDFPADYGGKVAVPVNSFYRFEDEYDFIEAIPSGKVEGKDVFARLVIRRKYE